MKTKNLTACCRNFSPALLARRPAGGVAPPPTRATPGSARLASEPDFCNRAFFLAALVSLALGSSAPLTAATIAFDSPRWEIAAAEHRIEEHLGRQSLFLRGGLALIKDDDFTNGIIEFDLAFSGERGFIGAVWRLQDFNDCEEFYLRPHQSGNPDANQYTPIFNGLPAWQLYHGEGYGAPVKYSFNQWMHIKIVVSGSQAEIYIDSAEPVLFIPELKRKIAPGKVGISVKNYAPAHFANFSYQKIASPTLTGQAKQPQPAAEGLVKVWQVSTTLAAGDLAARQTLDQEFKDGLTWQTVQSEPSGLVNLARVRGITREKNVVFARLAIDSATEQVAKISFGYSDSVAVYFNDQRIYSGSNLFRSRDYRYLGTIGFFDELYLPLDKGSNELMFAIAENFGGWGIQCRVEKRAGITLH